MLKLLERSLNQPRTGTESCGWVSAEAKTSRKVPTTIQCTAVMKQTNTGQRTDASMAASSGSVETNPRGATLVGNKVAILRFRFSQFRIRRNQGNLQPNIYSFVNP